MKRKVFNNVKLFFAENYTFMPKMLRIVPAVIFYFVFYLDIARLNYWYTKIKNRKTINIIKPNSKIVCFEEEKMHFHLIPLYQSIKNLQIVYFKSSFNNHYRSEFINFVLSHTFNNCNIIHLTTLDNFVYSSKKSLEKFKALPQKKIATLHLFIPDEEIIYLSYYFDKLIVFTEYQKMYLNQLGVENVEVIAHPVAMGDIVSDSKPELRKKYGIPEDKFVLSFTGFIRKDKGLDLLIESLEMLTPADKQKIFINLDVYRQDEHSKKSIESLRKLNVQSRINIRTNILSDQAMIENFVVADYFLIPYSRKYKQISGQLIEAAWRDIPVISSDYYPVGEEVKKYNLGYVFENDNPRSLYKLLTKIVNKELNFPVADQSYKNSLNPKVIQTQLENFYKNI